MRRSVGAAGALPVWSCRQPDEHGAHTLTLSHIRKRRRQHRRRVHVDHVGGKPTVYGQNTHTRIGHRTCGHVRNDKGRCLERSQMRMCGSVVCVCVCPAVIYDLRTAASVGGRREGKQHIVIACDRAARMLAEHSRRRVIC